MNRLLRKIHRWAGLVLAAFILFYCLTGILLNHRQAFDYFQTRKKQVSPITVQDQSVLQGFVRSYKEQIGRDDDPEVIRIKDNGVIEFLYGSHGRTTYMIDPQAGTMTRLDKIDQQPWYWLNRLHQAVGTGVFWVLLADAVAVLLIVVTLTSLFILRYRRQDFLLLTAGVLVLLVGMAIA